jgi:hypothetical protein
MDEYDQQIIGPYGLPHRNSSGKHVLELAHACELWITASFMKARHYATHFDLHNNCAPRQLDLILVSQQLGTKITDAKVYQPCNRSSRTMTSYLPPLPTQHKEGDNK